MNSFIDRLWFRRLRQLPHFRSPEVLELPRERRVMVFAPHSDDEWIGCGGTLIRLMANRCKVRVVVLSDGAKGDPEHFFEGDIGAMRQEETRGVLASLGIDDVCFLNFPDGDLGSHASGLGSNIARVYDEFAPDWVLTTAPGEHHRDHVCAGYLVMRHWLSRGGRERLLAYEIYGAIRLDLLVDITAVMQQKRALIRRYEIPLRYIDYEAACVSLARFRGILVGSPFQDGFAEGFMDIRRLDVYAYMFGGLLGLRW